MVTCWILMMFPGRGFKLVVEVTNVYLYNSEIYGRMYLYGHFQPLIQKHVLDETPPMFITSSLSNVNKQAKHYNFSSLKHAGMLLQLSHKIILPLLSV